MPFLQGLRDNFIGIQTSNAAQKQRRQEKVLETQYGFSTQGLEQPLLDPIDTLAGGLTAIPKGLVNVLLDMGTDLSMNFILEASDSGNEYLKAIYVGPRSLKAVGIDASKDLAGQFSALFDRGIRLEVADPEIRAFAHDVIMETNLGDVVTGLPKYQGTERPLESVGFSTPDTAGTVISAQAAYDPSKDAIELFRPEDSDSVLHEIQHAIQQREGFAPGSQPVIGDPMSYENYHKTAGEIEARDVVARKNLSAAERLHTQPYSSFKPQGGQLKPSYDPNPLALKDFGVPSWFPLRQ